MYPTKAQIEELVKRASTPVPARPVSIVTQTSRSPKHFKLIAQKERGSSVPSFIILAIGAVLMPVGSVAFIVLGIEKDFPFWLWVIVVPGMCLAAMVGVGFGLVLWQGRTPIFAKWCNTKRTVTYTFQQRLRTYHYVFAYKDCLGFHVKGYESDEGPDVHVLELAIRHGGKGKAGEGFHVQAGALRSFTLRATEGRFGSLWAPIQWDDESRAAARSQHAGLVSSLPRWISKFMRNREKRDGCEFFNVTVGDDWSSQELEELRQAIAQVTGLPASVPREFKAPTNLDVPPSTI